MLDTDDGARRLGEFAFGTNYGIQRFTKNILFDEKIGGTIHMALGARLSRDRRANQSAIHWDMICDLRDGGEVTVDGELFAKDGKFVLWHERSADHESANRRISDRRISESANRRVGESANRRRLPFAVRFSAPPPWGGDRRLEHGDRRGDHDGDRRGIGPADAAFLRVVATVRFAGSQPEGRRGWTRPAAQRVATTIVRRPTGGRAILHTDELTYSVIAAPDHPLMAGLVLDSYLRLSHGLVAGLRRLGIAGRGGAGHATAPGPDVSAACFEVPSAYEIVAGTRKLLGSAQARRAGSVLQHGSLPLTGDLTRVGGLPDVRGRSRAGDVAALSARPRRHRRRAGRSADQLRGSRSGDDCRIQRSVGDRSGPRRTYRRRAHLGCRVGARPLQQRGMDGAVLS